MTKPSIPIDDVREIVRVRLHQLSRGNGEFRETYLFRDDMFDGIKFEQGHFSASWNLTQSEVPVFRGDQQIVLIELTQGTQSDRQAA